MTTAHHGYATRAAAATLLLLTSLAPTLPAQTTSALQVNVGGLPSGVNAQVYISGPAGYQQVLTGTATLTGLTPGSYSIGAGVVSSGSNGLYVPSLNPGASIEVFPGQVTAAATVEYQAVTPSWQPIGPTAIQGTGSLAGAGAIRPIAINNSNPLEMFAGGGGDGYLGFLSLSGVYKTMDGGATWAQMNAGMTDPLVEALWLDQSSPSIVLAGTESGGIFRSTNAGAQWTPVQVCSSVTSPLGAVTAFVQTGGVLYAGSGLGLLKSLDDGISWCMEQPTSAPVRVLAVSGLAIYLGLLDGHVLTRVNANSAWISSLPGTPEYEVTHLAVNPTNPSICYSISPSPPPVATRLYLTTDGGHTWSPVTTVNLNSSYLQVIEFQPSNPQVIFAGQDGEIFRSTDGGGTWSPAVGGWSPESIYPDAGGVTGRVIAGTAEGIYLSQDNGNTWSSLNENLTTSILYGITVQGSSILTSAQDYQAIGSFDGGRTWQILPGTNETGEILFNPYNPSYAYYSTGTVNGFFYSSDGGRTFLPATSNAPGLSFGDLAREIAVDPSTPSTVYAAGANGVYQSSDWGRTFTLTNWQIPPYPWAITVDPSDARTIFVSVGIPGSGSQLYFTHDKGTTWTQSVFTDVGPGYFVSVPMTIAVDPFNSRNVVVGQYDWSPTLPGGGIHVSTDGGNTFTQANNGIQGPTGLMWGGMVSDVEFSPWYRGVLAASTLSGLYLSSDLGGHWTNLRENSVPYLFTGLAWANGGLYATTFGEGVLSMQFAAPLIVSPTSTEVGAAGAPGSISVVAPSSSTTWNAASNAAWITVVSGAAGSGNGTITYSIAPNSSATSRTGAITIGGYTFSVSQTGTGQPGQPQITAVLNVDYSATIAAGSWIVIEGSNLATATGDWSNAVVNGALPTTLNNVSVSVDGKPAYLYYVSPTQINAQTPDDSTIGPVSVVVTSNAVASAALTVPMNLVSPALFLWPQSYVVATHLDYSLAAANGLFAGLATQPAQPGETIILWGTGLGPGGQAGSVPQLTYTISEPVVVHFGTSTTNASSVAAGAGEVSVDQIAVIVPPTVSADDYMIGIEMGGTVYETGKLTVGSAAPKM
jgi:uncharacterized protein (TIGR03437 family)